MPRSRALNRFKRFTAKRRRRSLRSDLPRLSENAQKIPKPLKHVNQLKEEAREKELFLDLSEPDLITSQ